VLDQASGLLSYYTSKEKMKRGSRRAAIQLKGAIIGIDDEDDCTFTIRDQTRIFHFQAQNSEEREKWVQALESCIRRLIRPPIQVTTPPNVRCSHYDVIGHTHTCYFLSQNANWCILVKTYF
jgi:plasmid stabilization system protein ParE